MAKTAAKHGDEESRTRSRTKPSFEDSLARLEQIVEQLDDGNLPLAQSLDLFKEGTKLANVCRELLTQAELAVKEALDETQTGRDEDGGDILTHGDEFPEEEDGA